MNGWVARHVFKRLKFLGSKELSQLVTLVFISWWHGLWIGYLINFTFELPAVLAERKVILALCIFVFERERERERERASVKCHCIRGANL